MADLARLLLGAPQAGLFVGVAGFSNLALDASTDKIGAVFQAPEAATITHVGFRYGTRTGTPPTYKIGLQGVTTGGLPDGTYLGGGSPASATFTPPADATWNGTWQWIALDNSLAVTRGQVLTLVVEYSSGTVDGSNNGTFTYILTKTVMSERTGSPYAVTNTGSWGKETVGQPAFGFKSASKTYGNPWEDATTTALGTNGHRAALRFALPAGSGDTFKVAGLRATLDGPASADWKFGLWDAAGTMIQDVTIDADFAAVLTGVARNYTVFFDEASLTALNFGTAYYVGVERTTVSCGLYSVDVDSSAELTGVYGGSEFYLATWNGSAWTAVQTKRPTLELILDDATGKKPRAKYQLGI